jgi:hypothetical protein
LAENGFDESRLMTIGHDCVPIIQTRSNVVVYYSGLARRSISAERSGAADRQLGMVLTFVAGATISLRRS